MTTGEIMKARRKELGISAETVAENIGVSPATIYRYEKGDIEKVPGDLLEPLAKILRTTPAFLMGWSDSSDDIQSFGNVANIIPLPTLNRIPLLGDIACGDPILAIENSDESVTIPETLHADFALRCKGDSMINARILDGDIVYIQRQDDVDNGQIAAVIIDDEATLKRVYKDDAHEQLTLMPENPTYPPLVYRGEELNNIRILGRVVGFFSSQIK